MVTLGRVRGHTKAPATTRETSSTYTPAGLFTTSSPSASSARSVGTSAMVSDAPLACARTALRASSARAASPGLDGGEHGRGHEARGSSAPDDAIQTPRSRRSSGGA